MATSLSTSFEELIDRARHLPSITFEKTRGGVETANRMLTNARLSPCLELLSYNSSNNCRRLGVKRSKPKLSEEMMGLGHEQSLGEGASLLSRLPSLLCSHRR